MSDSTRQILVLFVIVVANLLVGWMLVPTPRIEIEPEIQVYRNASTTLYTSHAPIMIDGDEDFSNQGWPGFGTEEEPFVIENLKITEGPESIYIRNTRAYFEIRNCSTVSHDSTFGDAIRLQNVTHATVKNCRVDSYCDGIHFLFVNNSYILDNIVTQAGKAYLLENSNYCEILNNYATGVNRSIFNWGRGFQAEFSSHCYFNNNSADDVSYQIGFYVTRSENCELSDNSVIEADEYGFGLYYAEGCIVDNNTMAMCEQGLVVEASESCILSRNTFSGTEYGLHIESCSNLTLTSNIGADTLFGGWLEDSRGCNFRNNEFGRAGLHIEGYSLSHWLHNMSDNTVDGRPLGYFVNVSNMVVEGSEYGKVILANCSGVTIENGRFYHVSSPIELGFCKDCIVDNVAVYNSYHNGFYIVHSDWCNLTGNIAVGFGFCAFRLDYSDSCVLINNIAIGDGGHGFYIYGLYDCTLTGNIADGPDLSFWLGYSRNCYLTDNKAIRGWRGIHLGDTDNCTLINNTALDNSEFGVALQSSDYNLVLLNRFAYNTINAKDDGIGNNWDNSTHGNYWSDYDEAGTYPIPGSAGSVDAYPFILESPPPEIDNPPDIAYSEGSVGFVIVWHPQAEFSHNYIIFRDGLVVDSGIWNGSSISIDIDGLPVGKYNYTLLVEDYEDRTISDSVLVTVTQTSITTTTGTITSTTGITTTTSSTGPLNFEQTTLVILAGLTAGVILILIVIAKRRH